MGPTDEEVTERIARVRKTPNVSKRKRQYGENRKARKRVMRAPSGGDGDFPSPYETRYRIGTIGFALFLAIITAWAIRDSRRYLSNYFNPPVEITERQLLDKKVRLGLLGKRVAIEFSGPLDDTGLARSMHQSFGDSKLEVRTRDVTRTKMLSVGERWLLIDLLAEREDERFVGMMRPVPDDLKIAIVGNYPIGNYSDMFEPHFLDETAYKGSGPFWGLGAALVAFVVSYKIVRGEVGRVKQEKRDEVAANDLLKEVLAKPEDCGSFQ